MKNKAQIGTISHATLNPRDLLPALLFALEDIDQTAATRFNSELIEFGFSYSQCGVAFGPEEDWPVPADSEEIQEIIEEIQETLNEHAPDYCYFGAHPSDGADFGFWPDMDSIDDLPMIPDNSQDSIDAEQEDNWCTDVRYVNDHGNLTVYGADGSVLLELV